MPFLKKPLQITAGHLARTESIRESLDSSLTMFLNTPKGGFIPDQEFGFVFTGLRFELFDEHSGTVYDSQGGYDPVYRKKISGTSKNLQTFASDFNEFVRENEPRLGNVSTVMTYIREQRQILLVVRGVIVPTGEPYEFRTMINVWN